ncbi:MAG TPA: hypothetical protein DCS93_18230 [Microscillaceae bacterium]|nr:hypothetical protein [Microscillaceae bacterium]
MKTKKIKFFKWVSLWLLLNLALLPQITFAQQSSPYIDGLTSVCDKDTVQYSVVFLSGSVTWEIVGGGGYVKTASGLNAEIVWTAPGTRTLRATIDPEFGSTRVEETTITIHALPTITISGTKVVDYDGIVNLTASGVTSDYTWRHRPSSGGNWTTISNPNVLNITQNTLFEAEGTNSNGCRGKATWEVLVIQEPSVSKNFNQGWADIVTFNESYQPTTTPGANGNGWYWYTTQSGGSPLNTYNAHPVLNLSTLGVHTFYVASYNSAYGVTSTRRAVNILRLELQTSTQANCDGTHTINASVNGWPAGQPIGQNIGGGNYFKYDWYSQQTGGTVLQSGSTVNLGPYAQSTNVWVEASLDLSIYSMRAPITLTPLSAIPTPTFSSPNCGINITLTGGQSGDLYHLKIQQLVGATWTDKASSPSPNSSGVFNGSSVADQLQSDIRYVAYISRNGCAGATRTVVHPNLDPGNYSITFNTPDACLGQSFVATLNRPAGVSTTQQWLVNGVVQTTTSATTFTYQPTGVGPIQVSVIVKDNETGCAMPAPLDAPALNVPQMFAPSVTVEGSQSVGNYVVVRASGGGNGNDYRWFKDGVQIGGSAGKSYLIIDLTSTNPGTYTVDIRNTQGCTSDPRTIPLNIKAAVPKPVLEAAPDRMETEGIKTLRVSGAVAGQEYVWYGTDGVDSLSINEGTLRGHFTKTKMVKVKIRYIDGSGEGEVLIIPVRILAGYAQINETNLNMVGEQTIRKKYTSEAVLNTLSVTNKETLWKKTYLDGLGRPIQTINQEASPGSQDVVQVMVYDEIGRSPQTYLPFSSPDNPKGFKPGGVNKAKAFYAPGNKPYATDTVPYSLAEFEPSPLNRSFVQYAPGAHWVGAKKAVTTCLHTNPDPNEANTAALDKIRLLRVNNVLAQGDVTIDRDTWTLDTLETDENNQLITTYRARAGIELNAGFTLQVSNPTITLEVNPGDQNVPVVAGFYAQGELARTTITDEDGKVTEEFKNKSGQVILKRAKVDENTWAQTYYAYDDFGQLSYVLPPEAVKVLETHSWDFNNVTVRTEVSRLWYRYYYDGRKRLITKEVPGAGKVMMVYDRRDRLVLSQDANQRQSDEWSFTKYDELNRPVMTGIHTNAQTRAQLQAALDANFGNAGYQAHETMDTTAVGKANHLYTNQSFPNLALDVHSVTYYDNYHWKNDTTARYNFDATGDLNNLVTEPLTLVNTGQVTATKTKILGSDGTYLTTVSYYDCRGRVLQTVADNHLKGLDRTMTEYAFDGLVKQSVVQHYNAANNSTHYVTQWSEYDHTGRVKASYQEIQEGGTFAYKDLTTAKATGSVEQISTLAYNELGQLITKNLGETTNSVNPLQTLDFRYNIRGWMTHLNDANLSTQNQDNDLFGFELKYAQGAQNNYLNGNIGQMVWKSSLDNVQRQYDYTYDGLNRLTSADYSDNDTKNYGQNGRPDFDVSNITYDLNGNIQTLKRKGLIDRKLTLERQFGVMDDLTYQYRGNQLTQVEDDENSATTGVAGDFRNGHVATASNPDYIYDVNGNMIQDKNKEITTIQYNHLNLPTVISFSGSRRIEYTYDAAGIKLKKEVYENEVRVTWTNYVGSFVYEGDNLQFIHTAEGRALAPGSIAGASTSTFLYEYHYKDHLGNLRVAFREGQKQTYQATLEDVSVDKQQGFEYNEANIRATNPTNASQHSAKLTTSHPLGMLRNVEVNKGDVVTVKVKGYYNSTPTDNHTVNWGVLLSNLGSTTGHANSGEISSQNSPFVLNLGLSVTPTAVNSASSTVPNGYLRGVFYNKDGQPVITGAQIAYLQSSTGSWQDLELTFTATERGYLQVFVANESDQEVFFDDMVVEHTPQLIVQENHYYPFGMNLAGIEKKGRPEHKFTYNGKEKQKEFGLNWLDYGARTMDVRLGRFAQVDPHSENYFPISPYAYVGNNPIMRVDPDGKDFIIWYTNEKGQYLSYVYNKPGQVYKGNNQFVADVVTALNFITRFDEGKKYASKIAGDKEAKINIHYSNSFFNNEFDPGTKPFRKSKQGDITFNPEGGAESSKGVRAPVLSLFHEIAHAGHYSYNEKEFDAFKEIKNYGKAANKEEYHATKLTKEFYDSYSKINWSGPRKTNEYSNVNLGKTRTYYDDQVGYKRVKSVLSADLATGQSKYFPGLSGTIIERTQRRRKETGIGLHRDRILYLKEKNKKKN